MDYLPPFVVHNARALGDREIHGHAQAYRQLLEGLRDGAAAVGATQEAAR